MHKECYRFVILSNVTELSMKSTLSPIEKLYLMARLTEVSLSAYGRARCFSTQKMTKILKKLKQTGKLESPACLKFFKKSVHCGLPTV